MSTTVNTLKGLIRGMKIQDAPTPEQWEEIKAEIEMLPLARCFILIPTGTGKFIPQEIPAAAIGD